MQTIAENESEYDEYGSDSSQNKENILKDRAKS